MFPQDFFGWWDFWMGAIIGAYIPINNRARDYDCFGRMFLLGSGITDYHRYFDQAWPGTALAWIVLIFKVSLDGFNSYKMYTICTD
jgi:hypothetical protein